MKEFTSYIGKILLPGMAGVFCLLLAGQVGAGTWYVERDGSGDFTIIQDAVDAAAPGDTIFIGPGEYSELYEYQHPYWPRPTRLIAVLDKENLTFIGAGRDSVLIGPQEYDPSECAPIDGPIIFFAPYLEGWWNIEGITVRNAYNGIYTYGPIVVSECSFKSTLSAGITLWDGAGLLANNTIFNTGDGGGVTAYRAGLPVEIRDCQGDRTSMYFENCPVVTIDGFTQNGSARLKGVGLIFQGSSGTVVDWVATDIETVGLGIAGNPTVNISGSHIEGGRTAIELNSGGGTLNIKDSVLEGGRRGVIYIGSRSTASVTYSHLVPGSSLVVRSANYEPAGSTFDFSNNYWGTADRDSIDSWIIDSNDDPDIGFTIEYEPISETPLPTEQKSLGSFKAMFR
jgi:hypothetical protein